MRYKKAPILEAVLEFRWAHPNSLEEVESILSLPEFESFAAPKPRHAISASLDLQAGEVSQDRRHVGFEVARRDGTEIVFLEQGKFVFIQRAPYDRWEYFSKQALEILEPVTRKLGVNEFSRIGVRFVNRIDVPFSDGGKFNTDDYITVKFDGPRADLGIIDEFQMRLVKPTTKHGISYALSVATSPSPLAKHGGIILDIDVFTSKPTPTCVPEFFDLLSTMRDEKNAIFESCITDSSRALFRD